MDTKTLQQLSQDELIKLVQQLQLKIDLLQKGVQEEPVDFKKLVEAADDIIFVLDSEGNMIYRNRAMEDMFPVSRKDAIGMHFSLYLPAIELDRATTVFNQILFEGKSIHNEKMKTFDKDGNPVYLMANLAPIRDDEGNITGLFGILRNITEMHLMEKKLKESSRRLEEKIKEQLRQAEELKRLSTLNDEIINNSPIGIFTIDPTGIILTENPALRRIIGYGPDETRVGMNLTEMPGFSIDLKKYLEEIATQKKPVYVKNLTYQPSSQDRELTLNVRANPILDFDKKVKSILIMIEDATEQAQIQKRMQRAEKLSAMGLLAAGVAYELKVPINLLTIDLNFIENNIPETSPVHDYVKSMKDELSRISQITEQLLNLGKPGDDDVETFEVHKLITSHPIQITLNRLQKSGFIINTAYPKESPKIKGRKNQLIQALLHVISNAEEAMPNKGEIRINVGSVLKNGEKFASITIEDTGIGIPPENLSKIFQPFFTTKGPKSTGLGLMVTYTIINNHGGAIGVKSAPGEGTSFKILLPAID